MRFLYALIGSCLFATTAHAGAWTQQQGKGQVIMNGVYYNAGKLWDTNGRKRSQATYDKYELNPYAEYGLTNRITIGTNLSLQRASQSSNSNWGIGDSEFFLRGKLCEKNGFVVSAEPMIKLPSPESSRSSPRLGGSHPDLGLGLSGGYGFGAWGQNHFAGIDTQYRHRLGDAKNQVRVSATAGLAITDKWMVLPQVFTTWRTDKPRTASFTQSSADDYNLVKGQLSALYRVTPTTAIQAGAFADLDGKNVGRGKGVLLSVWKTF